MNPIGGGNPGQQGNRPQVPQHGGQFNQFNYANRDLYNTQDGDIITNNNYQALPRQRGLRIDTKVLLITLITDVIFFFYGMLTYTGTNTGSDNWRAGIFWFLFLMTSAMIGRWIRRRI
jgi:hypothetical protein